MTIRARVAHAIHQLLGPHVQQVNRDHPVVRRQRVLTPISLARIVTLGFLHHPNATDEQLAQVAAQVGTPVTPQAIDQRHTPRLVAFLENLVRVAITTRVAADTTLAPLLERFSAVILLDSSTMVLPDDQKDRFPGCGGTSGFGVAALKLQTALDMKSGALHATIKAGRESDQATPQQHIRYGPGTLRVTDLGYFCLRVFAQIVGASEHFLSRLQFGTGVSLANGERVNLMTWLAKQHDRVVDMPVTLGVVDQRACRLIA